MGEVDESATGSVSFWSDSFRLHGTNGKFGMRIEKIAQIAGAAFPAPLSRGRRPSRFPLAPSTERE